MNLIELKCKNCGATMKVNSELNEISCNFCGAKVLIDDEATKINRIENAKLDARIKNHEQDLREIEDKENINEKVQDKRGRAKTLKYSIIFAILSALMAVVGFNDKHTICAIISTIQVLIFIFTILLCDKIVKQIFIKDYKAFFWIGVLLTILWILFINK